MATCGCSSPKKKRVEQEKKKTSGLEKKTKRQKPANPGINVGSIRLERGW